MSQPQENIGPDGEPHPRHRRREHKPRRQPYVGIFMVGLGFFYGFIALVLLLILCGVLKGEEVRMEIENKDTVSRIGFGSCHRQTRDAPILKTIIDAKPQVFIFLGDNIYADTTDMSKMRADYDQLLARPEFKNLNQTALLLATWDDHDYGRNDAGTEYPKKKESEQEFYRAWGFPEDSPSRQRDGVYSSYLLGPKDKRVQIILLDTRYHRTTHKDNAPEDKPLKGNWAAQDHDEATVLGKAQWAWFEEQLREPARLRIIGSSIQLLSPDHRFERWALFPRERERFLATLRKTKAEGVIIISGDRHFAEISMMKADDQDGIGYPLFDVTSSSLNQPGFGGLEPNKYRLSNFRYSKSNFGWIQVDWDATPSPSVTLEIRGLSGKPAARQTIQLNRLAPTATAAR